MPVSAFSGARRIGDELAEVRSDPDKNKEEIARLETVLASLTIVERHASPDHVTFGATVTVQAADAAIETYRIVGVNERGQAR